MSCQNLSGQAPVLPVSGSRGGHCAPDHHCCPPSPCPPDDGNSGTTKAPATSPWPARNLGATSTALRGHPVPLGQACDFSTLRSHKQAQNMGARALCPENPKFPREGAVSLQLRSSSLAAPLRTSLTHCNQNAKQRKEYWLDLM